MNPHERVRQRRLRKLVRLANNRSAGAPTEISNFGKPEKPVTGETSSQIWVFKVNVRSLSGSKGRKFM